ncbi:ZZ type zinc finger domain-containing protein [Pseudohyphozyma bogoriensis]|nr:ZZ type zinc finger domain-containing protein [Pseudohyphozyma bogoriensis]
MHPTLRRFAQHSRHAVFQPFVAPPPPTAPAKDAERYSATVTLKRTLYHNRYISEALLDAQGQVKGQRLWPPGTLALAVGEREVLPGSEEAKALMGMAFVKQSVKVAADVGMVVDEDCIELEEDEESTNASTRTASTTTSTRRIERVREGQDVDVEEDDVDTYHGDLTEQPSSTLSASNLAPLKVVENNGKLKLSWDSRFPDEEMERRRLLRVQGDGSFQVDMNSFKFPLSPSDTSPSHSHSPSPPSITTISWANRFVEEFAMQKGTPIFPNNPSETTSEPAMEAREEPTMGQVEAETDEEAAARELEEPAEEKGAAEDMMNDDDLVERMGGEYC